MLPANVLDVFEKQLAGLPRPVTIEYFQTSASRLTVSRSGGLAPVPRLPVDARPAARGDCRQRPGLVGRPRIRPRPPSWAPNTTSIGCRASSSTAEVAAACTSTACPWGTSSRSSSTPCCTSRVSPASRRRDSRAHPRRDRRAASGAGRGFGAPPARDAGLRSSLTRWPRTSPESKRPSTPWRASLSSCAIWT